MRYKTLSIAIFALVMFASRITFAQAMEGDWYDDVGIYLDHDVEHHFFEARADFERNDLDKAAEQIRRSAALLKLEAMRAPAGKSEALTDSVKELKVLADKVEEGSIASKNDLAQVFARAHFALTTQHFANAKKSWSEKDTRRTGQALKATIAHLEHGLAWAGYRADDVLSALVADTASLTEKLIKDAGWLNEEVDKIIDAVGKEIEKFETLLKSKEQ